jgi:hypothetical protein
MTAFDEKLAAAIAKAGVPLSADLVTGREPQTLAERTASLRLEADIRLLVARQRACQLLADAAEHSHSPSDRLAYALDEWLITHPEAPVSTAADYPDWTPGGAT